MKTTLVALFLLFLSLVSFAEDSMMEGYLVTKSSDTLRGFIQDRDNDWRAKSIQFATTKTGVLKEYEISTISSFYLKKYDEYFFVETLEIDKKPIRFDNLESVPARKMIVETVFLKLIAGGKMNLFFYKDEDGKKHFFVQKDKGKIEELAFVKYYTEGRDVATFPYYLQTLKSLTEGCSKVNIKEQHYEESALKNIVTRYNSCFQESPQYVRQREKVAVSMGVVVGAKYSGMHYDGSDYASSGFTSNGASTANFKSVVNVMAGINIDFHAGRESNPFLPGLQLLWQESGSYSGLAKKSATSQRAYDVKFSYLTAAINLKYMLTGEHVARPYVKLGVGYDLLLNYTQHATFYDVITMEGTEMKFMDFRKSGLNFSLGAGLLITKRASVELTYQRDSMYGKISATASMGGIALQLGYRLF